MPRLMDKENGRKLLLELGDVLDKLEIPFFLIQGTALGAHRDQGFVKTEVDIDLGVLIEHLKPHLLVDELVRREFTKIELISAPFRYVRTLVVHKYGEKADIVGYMEWRGKRFAATPVEPREVLRPYCIVHSKRLLENYRAVKLFDRYWNIPQNIETYLTREYGHDWDLQKDFYHESHSRVYNYLNDQGITNGPE